MNDSSLFPAKQFDYERVMIWGDRLRVLLNSQHITKGEINATLKEKGVFVGDTDKSITVPLLSSCILTPDEFTRLIEKSFARESNKKYSSSKFSLITKGTEWVTELRNGFDQIVESLTLGDDREFASEPILIVESENRLKIEYQLRVLDFSKDWIEQEIVYPGEILISQSGNGLEVEVQRMRTSYDTNILNDVLTSAIGKLYKDKGVVEDEKAISIIFDGFTNSERIRFFMQLTSNLNDSFTFNEIEDFEIIRDKDAGALPKEDKIKWMEEHVNKIQIKGDDLGKVFLLEDATYYDYYYLVKMTASYVFKFGTNHGECSLEFAFSGKTSKEDDYLKTTFDFKVSRLSRLEDGSKERVRNKIVQNVRENIENAFQHVKNSQKHDLDGGKCSKC